MLREGIANAVVVRRMLSDHGISVGLATIGSWKRELRTINEVETINPETGGKVLVLNPNDPLIRSSLIKMLRRNKFTQLHEMVKKYKCSADQIAEAISSLEAAGYNVQQDGLSWQIVKTSEAGNKIEFLEDAELSGRDFTFGFISDTHLCSTYERLDILEKAYDEYYARGIKHVFHGGNIVDGECRFNKYELKVHGITDQALYCLDHYPQRSGVTTHLITADDHEGWWMQREGMDFCKYLCYEGLDSGRDDFNYLGYMEADFKVENSVIRVFHPGGGSSYAISYATQKIVESFEGGEKPNVLLCGHFHKSLVHDVRNVWVVQGGACQDQSTWMRKKRIDSQLAYNIVTVEFDERGVIRRLIPELVRFFDRGYHVKLTIKDTSRDIKL